MAVSLFSAGAIVGAAVLKGLADLSGAGEGVELPQSYIENSE